MDSRLRRLAQVLVRHSTAVTEGEFVAIEGDAAGEPLLLAIYEETLRTGGRPVVSATPNGADAALFALANDDQLRFVSPVSDLFTERADVKITVRAETDSDRLSEVATDRLVLRRRAEEQSFSRMVQRASTDELRWVECQYPTDKYAVDAHMSLAAYEQFFYRACLCDRDDPLTAWRNQATETRRLASWIDGRNEVRIKGPGTDLCLSIAGRKFIAAGGRRNIPSGEFFTGPVEDSVEGEITFHLPTNFGGREVAGVRLRFEDGTVIDAAADRGEDLLHRMLETDAGSRRVGEFGIGTNFDITRDTGSILFDEKIGGTVHLALGRSYPETGGVNASALHWDLVCDLRRGGRLTVDGEELQRNGRFVV